MTDLELPGDPEVAAGPEPEPGQAVLESRGAVPWEDPERPRLTGFFQTLGEILLRPAAFFATPAQGGAAEPLAFGLIASTAGSLLAMFWWALLLLAAGRGIGPGMEGGQMGAGPVAAMMVVTPLVVLAKLALGSLCLWGALALLGTQVGFARVWRIFGYAMAGMALAIIPFLGAPLATLMVLFILHQGIKVTWGMSPWRALGTLALFLILQVLAWSVLLGSLLVLLALLGLLFLG